MGFHCGNHRVPQPEKIHLLIQFEQRRNVINCGIGICCGVGKDTHLRVGQRIQLPDIVFPTAATMLDKLLQLKDGGITLQIGGLDGNIKLLGNEHIQPNRTDGGQSSIIDVGGDTEILVSHSIRHTGEQLFLHIGLGGNGYRRLFHRFGKSALIHLLVLGHGDGVDLHGNGRNHIRGLLVLNETVQRINGDPHVGHDICRNILATGGIIKGSNGGVLDAGEATDDFLHLGQFNAEAANLHLTVPSADKLQAAIRHITNHIAGVIHPLIILPGTEGIFRKGLSRLLLAVQIAAGDLTSGDPQFTCRAHRQQLAILVHHIGPEVVQNRTDGHIFILSVQSLYRCAHTALGGAVAIMETECWRIKRNQLFTAYRHMPQAFGAVHQCKLTAHLRGHGGMGNALCVKILLQLHQIQTDAFVNNMHGTAADQRRIGIVHVGVEAIAGIFRADGSFIKLIVPHRPVAEGGNIAVFQHDALGNTCGTGRIEQNKQVFRLRFRQFFVNILHIHDLIRHHAQAAVVIADNFIQLRRGDQHLRAAVLYHQVQTLRRIGGIQRHISAAGLQNSQRTDHHVFTAGDQYAHGLFTLDAASAQMHGKAVGDLVQLFVGVFVVQMHKGKVVRPQCSLFTEQVNDGLFTVIGIFFPVEDFNLCGSLCVRQFHVIHEFLFQKFLCDFCVCARQIFGIVFAEHIGSVTQMDRVFTAAQIRNFHQKCRILNVLFIVDVLDLHIRAVHQLVLQDTPLVAEADV